MSPVQELAEVVRDAEREYWETEYAHWCAQWDDEFINQLLLDAEPHGGDSRT
jgi:hypothetical protein